LSQCLYSDDIYEVKMYNSFGINGVYYYFKWYHFQLIIFHLHDYIEKEKKIVIVW